MKATSKNKNFINQVHVNHPVCSKIYTHIVSKIYCIGWMQYQNQACLYASVASAMHCSLNHIKAAVIEKWIYYKTIDKPSHLSEIYICWMWYRSHEWLVHLYLKYSEVIFTAANNGSLVQKLQVRCSVQIRMASLNHNLVNSFQLT